MSEIDILLEGLEDSAQTSESINILHRIKGLILPLFFAITSIWIGKINFLGLAQPIKALLFGMIITVICYQLMFRYIKEDDAMAKAALIGLLSAEVMVFTNESSKVSMAGITLWLFFYFHSVEH